LITEPSQLPLLPDCDIWYDPGFLSSEDAETHFNSLLRQTPWRQDDIRIFGKVYPQPRLTALYGNNEKTYSYSGIQMQPLVFSPLLSRLKAAIERQTGASFTTCLLNLYRDGRDSNGWHADNEKELGKNPVIASLSLGATRVFKLKHRYDTGQRARLELTSGSLLLMQGPTQHFWLHEIPKTKREVGPRINLTFRKID
jgi:alkylated DNA repair dioxygenase AlkB